MPAQRKSGKRMAPRKEGVPLRKNLAEYRARRDFSITNEPGDTTYPIAGFSWVNSLLNASMILSGMGPLDPMKTSAGKLFAGCYALFSGVAFLSSIAVVFAPVFHRFLHKFHLEQSGSGDKKSK